MAQSLVVIGNGLAVVSCVAQILKHAPKFEITIFGDESHVNYNRILLSSVLAGERAAEHIVPNVLPSVFCLPYFEGQARKSSLARRTM